MQSTQAESSERGTGQRDNANYREEWVWKLAIPSFLDRMTYELRCNVYSYPSTQSL